MKPSSSYILLPDELTYYPSVPKSVHDQVVIVVTVKLSSLIINKGPFIIYAGGGDNRSLFYLHGKYLKHL